MEIIDIRTLRFDFRIIPEAILARITTYGGISVYDYYALIFQPIEKEFVAQKTLAYTDKSTYGMVKYKDGYGITLTEEKA